MIDNGAWAVYIRWTDGQPADEMEGKAGFFKSQLLVTHVASILAWEDSVSGQLSHNLMAPENAAEVAWESSWLIFPLVSNL